MCFCFIADAQHEFGHNLNFAHSGEGEDAYADKTGYMGYSYREEDTPKMCFNAAKSWQTGWYADASMSMNLNTGECFIGKLYGINAYEPGNHSRTVLVKVTSGSSGDPENDHEYTFIDFNRREGINEGTREAADQVTVVRAAGGGTSYAHSKSLAELGYGESYMDEDPNGLHVQVLGIHLEESYADVMIGGHHCVAPPTTSPPTPTPPPMAMGCDEDNPDTESCCASSKICDVGQGNCGSDDECLTGLVCGNNNCYSTFGWGPEGHNCCEPKPVSELLVFLLLDSYWTFLHLYTYWIPSCWLFVRIFLYSHTCNSDASFALSTKTQPTWTTGMISRRR